jgi:peptide deformylase
MCKNIKIYQSDIPEENKVLRAVSPIVDVLEISSPAVTETIKNMQYFLEVQPDGVALAAPQIGKNMRIFVVSSHVFAHVGRNLESDDDLVFINPKVLKMSKKTKMLDEGCFSVRWFYGQVKRSTNITIEAYNKKGVKKTWGVGGLLAHVFQHEIEHLDGLLFSDKAVGLERMPDTQIAEIQKERKEMEQTRKQKKDLS